MNCNICYNNHNNLITLICCLGKQICNKCINKIKPNCPFCRKIINKRAIIIQNKNKKYKGRLILSINNINIIQI